MHAYTLVVTKSGELRFVGHRDWARAVVRALRRARLPLRMTAGFHPHVRLSLPEPLPLGVASEGERFVVELREYLEAAEVERRLRPEFTAQMELVALVEGNHREALDDPLELHVSGCGALDLVQAASRPMEVDASLAELRAEARNEGTWLYLRPPPGRRVSVGRVLARLREQVGATEAWQVCRVNPPLNLGETPLQ